MSAKCLIYLLVTIQVCWAGLLGHIGPYVMRHLNEQHDVAIQLKDEEIDNLRSELQTFRITNRILSDQVGFLKGNIHYYKGIALEAKREKESIRRLLMVQIDGIEEKHRLDIAVIKEEMGAQNQEEIRSMSSRFEIEKEQVVLALKSSHAKEVKEIKRDFQTKLDQSESEREAQISELKAELRASSALAKNQDVKDIRKALSSATSSKSQFDSAQSVSSRAASRSDSAKAKPASREPGRHATARKEAKPKPIAWTEPSVNSAPQRRNSKQQ